MSAARYVGRVGGLAVALGVGTVIVIGGGVAYADVGASGTTSVSHDTANSVPAGGQGKAEQAKKPKLSKPPKTKKPKAPVRAESMSLPDNDSDVGDTGGRHRASAERPASMLTAVAPKPTVEVSAPAAPVAAVVSAVIKAVPTTTKPLVGSSPTGPVESQGAWVLLAASRRELGVDRTLGVTPTSAVSPTAPVSLTATNAVSTLTDPGPVVLFDNGIIHGSIGTPVSGPVTYSVIGGAPGKVRILKTGDFSYLPNYTDVTSGTPEQFKVRVTQKTEFVTALKQIPLIGSLVPAVLANVRQIPMVAGLLTPLIGASVVVPVNVDIDQLVPDGATVAYTYKITSFGGTPISVNFFPALGLQAGHVAPTVLDGPGLTNPGDTNPYGQGPFGIGTLRASGYNVVSWDPRGEYASGGLVELDNVNFEAKDVSSIITWMAGQPGVQADDVATHDPRMGMIGPSYGGGIQWLVAATDKRVDAIVPTVAWNSLNDSLYPGGAFKTSWSSMLVLGLLRTGARVNPELYAGVLLGDLLGILTPYQQKLLRQSSPGALVDNITAPTLVVQGTVDDLFPLRQAITNVQLLSDNVDAQGNPVPVKMVWFCGGHGVCLDPQSPIQGQLLTLETLNWLNRYVKGNTSVNTGPVFQWVDQRGQFYASNVMPTVPSFYGTPITDTGAGGFMPIVPIVGGSGPLGNPLGLDKSLPIPTKAQNAINIPLALPTTGTTQLVGAPTLTVNYTGVGTSRYVYAQIVDDATGRVVGNVVTPIPVKLDGQSRHVTVNLEDIVYTAKPGDGLTLQLVGSTTPYQSFTSVGFINVSSVSVTLPTVGTGVVPVGPAPAAVA
ncbi:hypothetical protein EB75_17430 [Mycobacterium sp. ST-F2]|uniref:CocE/NonD family hydrolase n=1 Tax=Mycobacterium sp. ST-F2 TaxID=1490484 RepID=UPI00093F9C51|nr:CocE/NonD family hydrolase [Mycobacterium sp. ST-F2]OKH81259.1 hypothetical protein EB75_17430 [Mycobacterium sp. ST-F2]